MFSNDQHGKKNLFEEESTYIIQSLDTAPKQQKEPLQSTINLFLRIHVSFNFSLILCYFGSYLTTKLLAKFKLFVQILISFKLFVQILIFLEPIYNGHFHKAPTIIHNEWCPLLRLHSMFWDNKLCRIVPRLMPRSHCSILVQIHSSSLPLL